VHNALIAMDDQKPIDSSKLRAGVDYYVEAGLWVFTAAYHLRRGYCCKSGCRHCPYGKQPSQSQVSGTRHAETGVYDGPDRRQGASPNEPGPL
jgi:hypothetical protein